jgi:CheY-like chemotaxis protein
MTITAPAASSPLPLDLMVLIADDDPAMAELWRAILTRSAPSLCAVTAEDGAEAVRIARQMRPDVVLMDLAMPGTDGFAATQALKRDPATSGIPVIAVTGSVFASQRVLDVGCAGYLTKPVAPAVLVSEIARVLRGRPA